MKFRNQLCTLDASLSKIVFTVHDEQLVDDIPMEKLLVHDVPVDIICTPTRVIFTNTSVPKPQGEFSSLLSLIWMIE